MNPVLMSIVMASLHVTYDVMGYPMATFTSDGSKQAACEEMTPHHGHPAQTAPSPYIIQFDRQDWQSGSPVTLTLTSSSGMTPFKGFMLQARRRADASRVGSFEPVNGTKINCDDGRALSHDSPVNKTSLTFTWTPNPSSKDGDVEFIYTMVQEHDTFWVKKKSSVFVQVGGSGRVTGSWFLLVMTIWIIAI